MSEGDRASGDDAAAKVSVDDAPSCELPADSTCGEHHCCRDHASAGEMAHGRLTPDLANDEAQLDALLDEQLCDVPLPEGLTARLRDLCDEIPHICTDHLPGGARRGRGQRSSGTRRRRHARFTRRDEPLPSWLADAAPAQQPRSADDRQLDAALGEVALPEGFYERLCRLTRKPLRRNSAAWLQAAVLLLAVGVTYLGAMSALIVATYPIDDARGLDLADQAVVAQLPEVERIHPVVVLDSDEGLVSVAPEYPRPPELEDFARRPSPLPALDPIAQIDAWMRPALPSQWIFGDTIRGRADDMPEIDMLPTSTSVGMETPHLRGFDWRYFLQHDEWPVVWLHGQADPRLRAVKVPVHLSTDSYELARRYVADGELPPSKLVRKEEFLAAGHYPFPAPRGSLEMHLLAGPSPFRDTGLGLLQVGVQARHLPQSKRPPVHLVAVVDTSNSMSWGGRLALVRQALLEVVSTMQPDDRLSLITYSDQARVIFQAADSGEASGLRQAIDALKTEHATNIGAGVRYGYMVAASSLRHDAAAGRKTRMVLLSDGFNELREGVATRLHTAFEHAEDEGIDVSVVDLHQSRTAASGPSRLAQLLSQGAVARRVEYFPAASLSETRAAVMQVFTSREQEIARNVAIEVTFNHDLVAGYRLIGHEPSGGKLIGLQENTASADAVLYAGQAATALFELQLREPPQPSKGNSRVDRQTLATVKVTWRDPGTGRAQSIVRKINREQAAQEFDASAAPLQLAALLAETAEVLRDSTHARRGSLVRVLQLSESVHPVLLDQPAFQSFQDFLRAAIDASPLKNGRP